MTPQQPNNMLRRLLFVFALVSITLSINAQDIHFSQFYNSPLTLNPALTGKHEGVFRVAANYRNQYYNVVDNTQPYVTYAGSFDMPFVFKNQDALGVGLQLYQDNQGEGNYENLTIMISLAYHKMLGANNKHSLSLGLQGGYIQKKIGTGSFIFSDQYGGVAGTDLIRDMSREQFADETNGSVDMQAGLLYTGKFGKRTTLFLGGSIFNILAHDAAFSNAQEFKIPRRYVGHAGLDIRLGAKQKFGLLPSVIYMNQAKAQEINAGLALGLYFSEKVALYLGGYYRILESAPIAYMGIEFSGFKIGASYDFLTNDIQDVASGFNGSYELSLTYIMPRKDLPVPGSLLYNPRF